MDPHKHQLFSKQEWNAQMNSPNEFTEKCFQETENLEHNRVLLLFSCTLDKTGQHNLMILKWPGNTMHVIYTTIKWVKPGLSKLLKFTKDS